MPAHRDLPGQISIGPVQRSAHDISITCDIYIALLPTALFVVFLVFVIDKAVASTKDCMRLNKGYLCYGDIPVLNRKIVGGVRVTVAEHPYVVSIRRQFAHYLTGTLVGANLVLTVAHGLYFVPITELGVVAGENYNDRGSRLYTVIVVVIHERFDPATLQADLALLRLHEPVRTMATIKNIQVNLDKNLILANKSVHAFVTGWGRCDFSVDDLCLPRSSIYYENELMDPMLQSVPLDIIGDSDRCQDYNRILGLKIGDGMLCVGAARSEADEPGGCAGVPGAPLVVDGRLLGVQSWGLGCGYPNDLPLIYTDIRYYYHEWFIYNIEKFSQISKYDFKQLFEMTKRTIISEWFVATRNLEEQPVQEDELELGPLKIDEKLGWIKGDLYDIRDYHGGVQFHKEKSNTYDLIKLGGIGKELHRAPKLKLQLEIIDIDDKLDSEYYNKQESTKAEKNTDLGNSSFTDY